jgi:large subunit ribosomal protein L19
MSEATANVIRAIEASQMKGEVDSFKVGDTVKVHFKIIEGKTERIQIYEGLVIAIKNSRVGKTFIVRKNSYGVGVERVFPLHSPRVDKVEVVRPGKVRRAKLYYIRGKIGKAAKIKELIVSRKAKAAAAALAPAQVAKMASPAPVEPVLVQPAPTPAPVEAAVAPAQVAAQPVPAAVEPVAAPAQDSAPVAEKADE